MSCCETQNLAVGYGVPLLRDIALHAERGKILALIGPNGAGKSTLLKTLAGQLAAQGGAVLLDGQDLTAYTPNARARKLALMLPHTARTELTSCFEVAAAGRYPYTGRLGIFHGMKSYFCQDEYGQIAPVYSISAGLDYPGIGPEHAWLHDIGRAEYVAITDDEAVDAFEYLARTEGIIPAIESAHAVAHAIKLAPTMDKDQIIVITISGRGDKDCAAIARYRGEDLHE